jgi:D-alanyl-D-alanine carboxypeptidase (penicillin-binding protein 5/6)
MKFFILVRSYLAVMLLIFVPLESIAAPGIRPPVVAANSFLIMDGDTGRVLVSENENESYAPASLTKMMTGYVVSSEIELGNISLDDDVQISVKAWKTPGSRMFIKEGTTVKLSDLLRGMIIQSGNDASVALAEHIAGSEQAFADVMNITAQRLGMSNSNFSNATGLDDDDQYASAYDLAILAKAIINDYPESYKIYKEKEFTYNDITQLNRNRLLFRDPDIDGLKTGFTSTAKYCMVTSAKKKDQRLITVIMGAESAKSRIDESQKLLTYGFRLFNKKTVHESGEVISDLKVDYGVVDRVQLIVEKEVSVLVARGQEGDVYSNLIVNVDSFEAPIEKGEVLAQVQIMLGDEILLEVDVIAEDSVKRSGFFRRIWQSIASFFGSIF